MENESIMHHGIITGMNNDIVQVTIESKSACSSCHAQGACTSADSSTRIIEIKNNFTNSTFTIGDKVHVIGKFNSGLKAVLFAYVIPFVLILTTLIITSEFTSNNLFAGILSLGITIPYYGILYLNKKKFEREFSFTINTEA